MVHDFKLSHLVVFFVVLPTLIFIDMVYWGHIPFWLGTFVSFPIFIWTSLFHHRYYAHRAFEMPAVIDKIVSFISASVFQMDPAWWASNHRKHHRHSDTERDPHSPHTKSFYECMFLWSFRKSTLSTDEHVVADLLEKKDLKFYNKHPYFAPFVFGLLLFTGIYIWISVHSGHNALLFDYAIWKKTLHYFLWVYPIPCLNVYVWLSITNVLIHTVGHQSYSTRDQSRNSLLLSLLFFGEGWHNNHHKFPARLNYGHTWWQVDFIYWFARGLQLFGVIRPSRHQAE